MVYLLNTINSLDQIVYVLIFILIILLIILIYVIYKQNILIVKKEIIKPNNKITKEDLPKLKTEKDELQEITKKIESNYNRTIDTDISTYEEEQENNAIISYEELLKKVNDYNKNSYSYEEEYLKKLKELERNLK